jgi:hypothetical protein
MSKLSNNWSVQVAGMLVITVATAAVFWAAQGFGTAVAAALLGLAFTAIVHFGRRHTNTLEVMSGTGDERIRHLYMHAVAVAGTVMAFLLPGWFLVTLAQGDPDTTLSTLSAIFGVTFILAVVVLARRG